LAFFALFFSLLSSSSSETGSGEVETLRLARLLPRVRLRPREGEGLLEFERELDGERLHRLSSFARIKGLS